MMQKAVWALLERFSKKQRIAVGISGGVDSAVAAMLLQKAGHDIVGVFMRNWDEAEEIGNSNCSIEQDLRDAAAVCRQLKIPLHEADFIAEYWNKVFTTFLSDCSRGLTPNPDLACNRYIKFGALLDFAKTLGVEKVATGHYARLERDAQTGEMHLLKGVDSRKDQSYFLASVHSDAFEHVVFPLGGYTKEQVREIAKEAGLAPASKRSSAGICFIGRRNFAEFITQYVSPIEGRFVDVETGKDMGLCSNLTIVTFGQRPGIGGHSDRTYVAGKDVSKKLVYIASGKNHPSLLATTACLRPPHWLSSRHRQILERQGQLRCEYKSRYSCSISTGTCVVSVDTSSFQPSMYCGLVREDAIIQPGSVVVNFERPATAITPQQVFVMYDGDVCIGSAEIAMPGETVYELQRRAEDEFGLVAATEE